MENKHSDVRVLRVKFDYLRVFSISVHSMKFIVLPKILPVGSHIFFKSHAGEKCSTVETVIIIIYHFTSIDS